MSESIKNSAHISSPPPSSQLMLPVEPVGEPHMEELDMAKAANYSVANLGAALVYGLFNFGMPLYLETYHLPASLIGLLANERSFVGAFIQPIVGRISDHTRTPLGRRRPFFLLGIPLMALSLFTLALHPPFWLLMVLMTVGAFFLAVAWDPYMALMADIFHPAQSGRVGGFVGLGTGIGNLAFAFLALALWSSNEFLVFSIVVAALVVTWGYTFFTVKEPPLVELRHTKRPKIDFVKYIRDLRQYPEAAKYTLALTFFWLGTGGAVPFITLFAVNVLHSTKDESFYLPMGAIITTGLFVALIGSQSATLWQGVVALAIIGVGNASTAQINPMLADLAPRDRMAEIIGLVSAVFSFAQPLGSALAGGVVEISKLFVSEGDAYRWAFIFAGGMILLSAALLQTVHPERVREQPQTT
jgi:MFS family permease